MGKLRKTNLGEMAFQAELEAEQTLRRMKTTKPTKVETKVMKQGKQNGSQKKPGWN